MKLKEHPMWDNIFGGMRIIVPMRKNEKKGSKDNEWSMIWGYEDNRPDAKT